MATKNIKVITDKITQVNQSFTVNMYDNGFMVEVSGRNDNDDWRNAKIICNNTEELLALINEVAAMPREE